MTATAVSAPVFEVNDLIFASELPWRTAQAPRVLIVEDDEDVQNGWSVFLRHQGYDVCSAHDGPRGLDLVESEEPEIVLLDLGLPGMHGFKILHEIRMRGLPTKVIVISATVDEESQRRAFGYGACRVLPKPVNMHRLVSIIEDLLAG